LPQQIRLTDKFAATFKKKLKTHLFDMDFFLILLYKFYLILVFISFLNFDLPHSWTIVMHSCSNVFCKPGNITDDDDDDDGVTWKCELKLAKHVDFRGLNWLVRFVGPDHCRCNFSGS